MHIISAIYSTSNSKNNSILDGFIVFYIKVSGTLDPEPAPFHGSVKQRTENNPVVIITQSLFALFYPHNFFQ